MNKQDRDSPLPANSLGLLFLSRTFKVCKVQNSDVETDVESKLRHSLFYANLGTISHTLQMLNNRRDEKTACLVTESTNMK